MLNTLTFTQYTNPKYGQAFPLSQTAEKRRITKSGVTPVLVVRGSSRESRQEERQRIRAWANR